MRVKGNTSQAPSTVKGATPPRSNVSCHHLEIHHLHRHIPRAALGSIRNKPSSHLALKRYLMEVKDCLESPDATRRAIQEPRARRGHGTGWTKPSPPLKPALEESRCVQKSTLGVLALLTGRGGCALPTVYEIALLMGTGPDADPRAAPRAAAAELGRGPRAVPVTRITDLERAPRCTCKRTRT